MLQVYKLLHICLVILKNKMRTFGKKKSQAMLN